MELKTLPENYELKYLVSNETEFLTGDIVRCADAADALYTYDQFCKHNIRCGLIGIGYRLSSNDHSLPKIENFFFSRSEDGPHFEYEMCGFEYYEVRQAVLDIFKEAKKLGIWSGDVSKEQKALEESYILYCDKTQDNRIGLNGQLLSTFDPDARYEDREYVEVYFRIKTKGFSSVDHACQFDGVSDRDRFGAELEKLFAGWNCRIGSIRSCSEIRRGEPGEEEYLYLHPMEFAGWVKKKNVGEIARMLRDAHPATFRLKRVDLYESGYIMSDAEYENTIHSFKDSIENFFLCFSKTRRRDRFIEKECLYREMFKWLGIPLRANARDCLGHVYKNYSEMDPFVVREFDKILMRLVDDGWIDTEKDGAFLRRINKTEQKRLHLTNENIWHLQITDIGQCRNKAVNRFFKGDRAEALAYFYDLVRLDQAQQKRFVSGPMSDREIQVYKEEPLQFRAVNEWADRKKYYVLALEMEASGGRN